MSNMKSKSSQKNQEDDYTDVDTRFDIFKKIVRTLGSKRVVAFHHTKFKDMHKYILFNCSVIDSCIE